MSKTHAVYLKLTMKLLLMLSLISPPIAGCAGQPPAQLIQRPGPGQVIADAGKMPASGNAAGRQAPAENTTPVIYREPDVPPEPDTPVQIALIHYRGTLQPLGCCSPGLYETDEFVVIQNFSNKPQDIRGWRLVNVTKGYPSFTFPEYFPCVPFRPTDVTPFVASDPRSLGQRLATPDEATVKKPEGETVKIDWSQCQAIDPLDETRMAPMPGQQGQSVPCILYPGQSVLVYTDEIHCKHGGLSFNYGNGNVWNNNSPETAVLYNARGEEVSRRSYQVK